MDWQAMFKRYAEWVAAEEGTYFLFPPDHPNPR